MYQRIILLPNFLLAAKYQHAFELNKINKMGLNLPIPLNRKLRQREFLLTQTKFSFEFIKLLTNFGQDFNNKSDTFQLFKIESPWVPNWRNFQFSKGISRYEWSYLLLIDWSIEIFCYLSLIFERVLGFTKFKSTSSS